MLVLNKSEKKASWRTRKKPLGCLFGLERCDQKGEGKKVLGWGCWECPSEGREATRQAFDFFFCHPTIQKYSPKVHQNVCSHNSAGLVSFMWCQNVKISPAPNDMFTKSEFKLSLIDSLTRSYGIQKLLRCR